MRYYDHHAIAAPLSTSDLFDSESRTESNDCEHKNPMKAPFCSTCGQKLGEVSTWEISFLKPFWAQLLFGEEDGRNIEGLSGEGYPLGHLDEFHEFENTWAERLKGSLKIITTQDDDKCLIGLPVELEEDSIPISDLVAMEGQIKAALAENGLSHLIERVELRHWKEYW